MPDYRNALVAALLAAQTTVMAQTPIPRADMVRPPGANGYFAPGERMEVVDPDKKLSAGDELTLLIEEDREAGQPKMVTATGDIDVYGYRIKVAGKTTGEAAGDIKRALERDFYYTATVKLSIDRVSRTVVKAGQITVAGEVRSVGQLDLLSGEKLTLSQAILKAGGFKDFADGRKVQITRQENGKTNQYVYDVKDILKKGAVDRDPILQDGDRIFVPRSNFTF